MRLLLALLIACTGEPSLSRVPAPAPTAPLPLSILEPGPESAPAPRAAPPPPRDPLATPTIARSYPERCAEHGRLSPSASEDGQWAAVRVTPTATPFPVHRVWVTLVHGTMGGVGCDASKAHQMRLYVMPDGAAPPIGEGREPVADAAYTFNANKEQPRGDRQLTAQVGGEITIQAGQSLWVVLDTHHGPDGRRTCLKTCLDGPRSRSTSWSNHREPAAWAWSTWTPSRGTGVMATIEGYP